MRAGLHSVVPERLLRYFSPAEFSLLLNGLSDVSVEDWRRATSYTGCSVETAVVKWFWALVEKLSMHERALLLQFATGCCNVPIGGFSQLRGLNSTGTLTGVFLCVDILGDVRVWEAGWECV
eukprot:m.971941 g.971941  ORF g.971941 m.971941 type:complete len:122 (+) comp23927_c0_seq29:4018-4383(+)